MLKLHTALLLAPGAFASCKNACSELSSIFQDQYTDSWSNSTISLWDEKQRQVVPACVISPGTSQGVSQALRTVLDNNCTFAVHSGGHAQTAGSSNLPSGVTIDLSSLDDVIPVGDYVKLGAGLNLTAAHNRLYPLNLTTILGHSGGVGIGGYSLAGGISVTSHRYGMIMDNIYQYELVLPNATMINVTYDSHPDLYYALRGAGLGANFGIVTSFIAKAMPASAQLSGTTTYTEEHLSHVLQEVYNLTAGSKADDLDAWWNFRYDYNVTTDSFGIAMPHGYTRPVRHPEVFANLETIPSTSNSLQIAAEREFVAEEAERTPNGLRNLFGTITYRPSPELDQEIFNIFRSLVPSIANASGVYPNIINQALYASYLPFMRERGGNCVGLKDLEGSYTVSLFTVSWNDASDDARLNEYMQKLIEGVYAVSGARNATIPWIYANYAYVTQKPFQRYGEENYQRLQEIQKEVDPHGVFTSKGLFPGGFKLN